MNKEPDWKKVLSPKQYTVLREKGTEPAFTGEYNNNFEEGVYHCAGCGEDLFVSSQKFQSSCGWPSFDNAIEDKIDETPDYSHHMIRTEITCKNCGGHLGHIFNDGPTSSGLRYCVNSISLRFENK